MVFQILFEAAEDNIAFFVIILVFLYTVGLLTILIILGIRENFRPKKTRKHEEEISPEQY